MVIRAVRVAPDRRWAANLKKTRRGEGMTQGTSTHGGGLSAHWTDAGHTRTVSAWWRRTAVSDRRIDWARVTDGAAPLQLLALSAVAGLILGLLLNPSWPGVADAGP